MAGVLEGLGLSRDWLEERIRESGSVPASASITSLESKLIGQDRGWCSDVVLVSLVWDTENCPAQVVLKVTKLSTINSAIDDMLAKGGVDAEAEKAQAQARLASVLKVHATESAAYDILRQQPPLMPMARSFFSQAAVAETGQPGVIALESMVGRGRTANLSDGLRLAQLQPLMEALAALHNFSFRNPEAGKVLPPVNLETAYPGWDKMVQASLNQLAEMEPRFAPFKERLSGTAFTQRKAYIDLIYTPGPCPPVIVHGDFQANNFLYREEEGGHLGDELVAVLDWQGALWKGSPAMDLVRVLVTAAAPGVREAHEEELLRHYHNHLSSLMDGSPPMDWVSLRREYARFFWFGASAAIVGASFFIASAPQLLRLDGGDEAERRAGLLQRAYSALSDISNYPLPPTA